MKDFLIKTAIRLRKRGYYRLSFWFLERAKRFGAQERAEELLREEKQEYARYLLEKAREYEKKGDFTEALILIERAEELGAQVDKDEVEALREKSRKQKEFETKLLLNPASMGFQFASNYRKWLFSLTGTPHFSHEDDSSRKILPPELLKVWKEAYEKPEDYEAQYKLALNFSIYGYTWEAISQAQKAESLKKTSEVEFLMGILYMELGEKEKAGEKLTCALELDPQNQAAYYFLGKLFLDMDEEAALFYLRRCIEIDPTTDIAESALDLLGGIKREVEV